MIRDDLRSPARLVASLRDAVAPGSYLTISHIGTEFFPDREAMERAQAVYERASERVYPRAREQILGFFDGWELVEPGLVPKHEWRPLAGAAPGTVPNIQ